MGVAKRIVFPVLRLLIWAVIAAALVFIAIKPGGSDSGDGEGVNPGANFLIESTTPVRGDIENKVALTGSVVPDASVEVKATSGGTVHRLWVGDGAEVEKGAPLIVLRELLGDGTNENLYTTSTIWANQSGRVTIDVKRGEEITLEQVVAKITSGIYVIEADIQPHQMYQLVDAPSTAQVTITNGPPEFTCTGFSTRVVEGEEGVGTKGRCYVPSDVLVFPGLSASIELVTESASNVLLLPVTAVEGTIGQGKVWRMVGGQTEEVQVGLGLTDGEMIEITSGLNEGDEVLAYASGTQDPFPGWGPYPGDGGEFSDEGEEPIGESFVGEGEG